VRHFRPGSFRRQVNFLRQQFLQGGALPFSDVLTEDVVAQALVGVGRWLDRVFSPLVTLWVFLGQVLSADHSCRAAVARLIAYRLARGQRPCSAATGANAVPISLVTASVNRQLAATLPSRAGQCAVAVGPHSAR
jgi:hypothetical protein